MCVTDYLHIKRWKRNLSRVDPLWSSDPKTWLHHSKLVGFVFIYVYTTGFIYEAVLFCSVCIKLTALNIKGDIFFLKKADSAFSGFNIYCMWHVLVPRGHGTNFSTVSWQLLIAVYFSRVKWGTAPLASSSARCAFLLIFPTALCFHANTVLVCHAHITLLNSLLSFKTSCRISCENSHQHSPRWKTEYSTCNFIFSYLHFKNLQFGNEK